jgi:hypothetical protein
MSDTSETLLALTALQERDARKARTTYLIARGLDEIDDDAVCEHIEELVHDAIMFGEDLVEIDRYVMEVVALLLKQRSKPRGGQRSDRSSRLRRETLVSMGLKHKGQLIANGMNATQAHLEGAEFAAAEARQRGIRYSDEYIAREMHKKRRPKSVRH